MAGTPEQQAEDLMRFFADPEIKAVFAAAGGFGAQYLLPLLDYDLIRKNPKPLIGFSDTTALQAGILARTGNPQLADFALDKAYYEDLKALADAVSSPFVKGYVTTLIDSANLRAAVRCVRMGKDAEFLRGALVAGGNVPVQRLVQAVFSGEGIAAAFASTPFSDAAALGAAAIEGGTMTEFERECDNAVNRYMTGAHLKSFGPEQVVGYLTAEEGNTMAVRMVLTGLLAGIDPERLKERLRESYV